MTANVVTAKTNTSSFRAARARRIRDLMLTWTENTIELGRELKLARDSFERGPRESLPGWEDWLKEEVGFSINHAGRLIVIGEKFGDLVGGVNKVATSFRVLEYLSRDHIPEEGRRDVIGRIQQGEKIGKRSAQEIVDRHRPTPKEANKIAAETKKPTLASDGNYYLGATKEQAKQTEQRRRMVFDVHRAIETLATMDVTPNQFLKEALPHQLWTAKEEHMIRDALKWLTAFNAVWEHRK